ncbi:MAG: PAS domain S-box protein [Holophaga sp.]|nr:PAS domain S-box protein [Holophaga sp.]
MDNGFQKARGKDTAAVQFMVFDILENLVNLSENPGRLGSYFTQQVRELVGARVVAILRPTSEGPGHDHALLAIEPQRHATPDTLALLEKLAHRAHEEAGSVLWQGPTIPESVQALLDSAGFNGAMILPLRVGKRQVGMVVVLHLLDMQRNEETLRALEILAPVAALVIQNAIFFESQEAEIQARIQDLREHEMRHRTILQTALDGFWLVDLEGRLLEVNETYCRMSGYSEQELLTKYISDLEANESAEDTAVHIRTVMEMGEMRFESNHRRKDGSLFQVEISVQFQPAEGGTLVAFLRDITERNRALQITQKLQAQLQQSQKMESLGTLAGGVAHDMNNVLGAILGLASANVDTQPPESPIRRALETIINAADRGGKMIKSLLSFARQSPEEIHVLNLNDILQEEVRMLERTTFAKVELTMDLATELRPIKGDANALTHAFMNLCVNAVDAMADNGLLTLRTRNVDQAWVEVIVEDNGSGMTPEVMAKAMEPFFTTKETGKGTGLGLSMAYSTVMAHRGQMDIQSNPGQGTRVRMRFPACEAEAIHSARLGSTQTEPRPVVMQVLLVDDDELIQNSMLAIMEALGHHATGVCSGEEALTKLEAGFQPHVVILDMNMPGWGGAGTLPRLRALNPTVPVLLATGRVDQTALNLAAAHPFVTLLSKPFSMKDLQQRLAELKKG